MLSAGLCYDIHRLPKLPLRRQTMLCFFCCLSTTSLMSKVYSCLNHRLAYNIIFQHLIFHFIQNNLFPLSLSHKGKCSCNWMFLVLRLMCSTYSSAQYLEIAWNMCSIVCSLPVIKADPNWISNEKDHCLIIIIIACTSHHDLKRLSQYYVAF